MKFAVQDSLVLKVVSLHCLVDVGLDYGLEKNKNGGERGEDHNSIDAKIKEKQKG